MCQLLHRDKSPTLSPTWEDIEREALSDPVLYAAVTMVRLGASKEDALIGAALALSAANCELKNLAADALAKTMRPVFLQIDRKEGSK